MNIKIDLSTVLERAYADSAWHAAYNPGVTALTPDNRRRLEILVESGANDLRSRMSGYVSRWNFNRFLAEGNITIALDLPGSMDHLQASMEGLIVDLLANYALMRHYGDEGTHFGTAWRMHRARMMIVLGRASAGE